MKLRIFPQTKDVKNVLQERIGESSRLISDAETELSKLTTAGLLYNPGRDLDINRHNNVITNQKAVMVTLSQQIAMLESHGKPETMVEIDL